METATLLKRYRSDRRKLLEYLLTCGLIKEIRTSAGPIDSLSNIDFDTLSVDYILHCVQSGGVVNITEASKQYLHESAYPVMIHSRGRDSYFLVGHSEMAGSPPKKVPPSIPISQTTDTSRSMSQMNYSHSENVRGSENGFDSSHKVETSSPLKPSQDIEVPMLGLPKLNTGLSDDDLRESAYELLLASVLFYGVKEPSFEDRKRDKSSKLLSGLKSKRDKTRPQTLSFGRHSGIIDIVRGQMQISEAMDACLRRNMVQLVARRTGEPLDIPYISLGLLNGIFKSDFPNEKYYTIWKSRQANMLEELLCFCTNFTAGDRATVKSYLSKIRNTQEWDTIMSPSERVGVVACIRQMASKLSSLPGLYGIEGETFYWSAGYRLNIRIYEKLLFGLFDILDEDQLLEEVDEVLMLIKLTWPVLGITQRIHYTLYAWILFQQFVRTGESFLLESATCELQKVLSCKEDDRKEKQYMNSLMCSLQFGGRKLKLSMMQVILILISMCCVNKLESYHLHFSKKPSQFKMMMNLLSVVGLAASDSQAEVKLIKMTALDANVSRKLKSYAKSSIKAACEMVSSTLDLKSKAEGKHPLATLAYELKLIAEREVNVFFPVLRHLCPEALLISVVVLHRYYGERLKPFLKGVSSLSHEVRSVFPAADLLDRYLTQIYTSALEANRDLRSSNQSLDNYQIGEVSKSIILDWLISQHNRILEWTHRAFDIEDWEPLSSHQRQAASIVEVFRIVEETVDQIFGLDLPMDITHLQALLSVIFHSLDTYLQKLLSQLVEKNNLYPAAPPLTRYTESVMPVIRKKVVESKILDDNVSEKLSKLTLSKLCVMLNTLQYIQKQVDTLEEGIRKHWTCVRQLHIQEREKPKEDESLHNSPMSEPLVEDYLFTCNEEVDALFATTLSIIKDTTTDAIKRMCDFTGARVVFWDLREKFLFCLYCGDVESSRLEIFLPLIDTALDQICGLIDDSLRDLVVLSVCRALLEGFVWVLLDGGPSRAFSDTDVKLLEEDVNVLKEFFIANGEGLPRSLVEQEAKYAQEILSLFSLETESIAQMLMIASESLSTRLDLNRHANKPFEDAHTLVRVLSHKKDREASKFLKSHYQLPMSSEYEETTNSGDSTSSPLISDLLKRSASIRWSETGQKSFRSMKKKLQEAQLKLVT